MKALVLRRRRSVELVEIPRPRTKPGEVLVRVQWASICATDLRIFREGGNIRLPRVLGHDFAGRVEEIGESVAGVNLGDRVAVDPAGFCGHCMSCAHGRYNLCEYGQWLGFERDGGLAEFVAVPARNLVKVPAKLHLECAAVAEPFVVSLHTLDFIRAQPGETMAVWGCGPIGLAQIQIAKLVGLRVIALEPKSYRRRAAVRMGANLVLDPYNPRTPDKLARYCDGLGPHYSVEASGSQDAVDQCGHTTRAGGTILFVGSGKGLRGPYLDIEKEHAMFSVELGPFKYGAALDLMDKGKINVRELISHRVPLAKVPNIFRRMSKDRLRTLRVLVRIQ